MNIFGWLTKCGPIQSMSASCSMEGTTMLVSVCEATSDGMVCTFPSCRLASSLMDLISTTATVRIGTTSLEGILSYYTIEESTCRIGITLDRRHLPAWRRICAEKAAERSVASARQAPA